MNLEELFVIRPTNEEQNDFVITIGDFIATNKHFTSRESAREYIATPQWDMIFSVIGGVINMHELKHHELNNNKE